MSLSAAQEMIRDISKPVSMPTDYCTANSGSPYGNDDILKRSIGSVISENVICILLIVVVVLMTSAVVYYVGRMLYSILKEYKDHTVVLQMYGKSSKSDIDEEDEVYSEVQRVPKIPQVFSVKKRLTTLEKQYKSYNEAISKRRDGNEAVVDSRIMSRKHDNYTYKKGVPEPTISV